MAKKKNIPVQYTNRDFESIREELISIATRYYPDTFQDFNEASFGSMMVDTVAYVGDLLSFYLDYQANESFLDTAVEYDNLLKLGKQVGFKFEQTPSSQGTINLFLLIPAAATGLGPDPDYIPILRRGAEFESADGVMFSLVDSVNFADSTNEVVVADVDSTTGIPTKYAIKTQGTVTSGLLSSEQITLGGYQKFLDVSLSDGDNITEVVSVYDTQGNRYYEVDYLSQNTIYKEVTNQGSDKERVKSILKPMVVPRRFVVDQSLGGTTLQFGYGSETTETDSVVSDPSSVVLKQHGKTHVPDTSFDPSKLIETDKFGISPANTTLDIYYRYNTAGNVNVFSGLLNIVRSREYIFPNEGSINSATRGTVATSLEVSNPEPILGDISFPSTRELKHRIMATNATQNRAVTKQDYINICYRMPAKFGKIKRVNIAQDPDSFKRNLNLYVLGETPAGRYATATSTLKSNLKTWLNKNRMINDTIDILDAKIVNLGVKYVVQSDSFSNSRDLSTLINLGLAEYFRTNPYDISEPFSISALFKVINSISGVDDIITIKIEQKTGSAYSDVLFDLDSATSADGRVIYAPENVAFEVAFTDVDIEGTVR